MEIFKPIWLLAIVMAQTASPAPKQDVAGMVRDIRHADYAGDRARLQTLYAQLSVPKGNNKLAARIHYWRGFAMWRRGINGFNDGVNRSELQQDLETGRDEFQQSAKLDSAFADAKIGELGCLSLLGYIRMENGGSFGDPELQPLLARMRQLRGDVEAIDPGNPRLLWVMGPNVWKSPPERGGGEAKAMEMYEKGLATIRQAPNKERDPLEPTWGEPELLMNLAYSNLNRAVPDLAAAQNYADSALKLVPYWHYVRDILKPQIAQAKKKD
jgi:hypothetical protein